MSRRARRCIALLLATVAASGVAKRTLACEPRGRAPGGAARTRTQQKLVAQVAAAYLVVLGQRGVLDAHDRRIRALEEERERVRRMREVGRAARVELALATGTLDRGWIERNVEAVR